MAQYTVTHACGHQQSHNITGPDTAYRSGVTRREWIAQQRAAQPCRDCRSGALLTESTGPTARAEAAGLPELTGSEKQIAWAQTIRMAELDALPGRLARFDDDVAAGFTGLLWSVARRQTSASWWIDHRNGLGFRGLINDLTDAERVRVKELEATARERRAGTEHRNG
jgi:hypothetical protein